MPKAKTAKSEKVKEVTETVKKAEKSPVKKAAKAQPAGSCELYTKFKTEILPKLKEELKAKNVMSLPKVQKVSINIGIGSYITKHGKDFEYIVENVRKISGQKPIVTKAKKAISNFKLRENAPVGITVIIRGKRMYDFLNKLINIVFPRVRDFRGLSPKSFDGQGNYSIGFKEHTVFPEISPDDVMKLHGIEINITTSATNNEQGMILLTAMGFPFRK